jgi:hypothetical protein
LANVSFLEKSYRILNKTWTSYVLIGKQGPQSTRRTEHTEKSTLRLPSINSWGLLRVDPERRFLTPLLKAGLASEWVKNFYE